MPKDVKAKEDTSSDSEDKMASINKNLAFAKRKPELLMDGGEVVEKRKKGRPRKDKMAAPITQTLPQVDGLFESTLSGAFHFEIPYRYSTLTINSQIFMSLVHLIFLYVFSSDLYQFKLLYRDTYRIARFLPIYTPSFKELPSRPFIVNSHRWRRIGRFLRGLFL